MASSKFGRLGKRVPGVKALLTPEEEAEMDNEPEDDTSEEEIVDGDEPESKKVESWAYGPKEYDEDAAAAEEEEEELPEPGAPTHVVGEWSTEVVSYLDILPPRVPGKDAAQESIVEFIRAGLNREKEYRKEEAKRIKDLKEQRLMALETMHRGQYSCGP